MHSFFTTATLLATTFSSIVSAAPVVSRGFPGRKSQIVAYYGQTSGQGLLQDYCNDPNIDIIPIAFVNGFPHQNGNGDYPQANFGDQCGGTAPGTNMFNDCWQMKPYIQQCQNAGKKILISIGGDASQPYSLSGDAEGVDVANVIWNTFGPMQTGYTGPRPFGDLCVDGFDFDIEMGGGTGYGAMANQLRTLMDATKPGMLLTAAPQCVVPDANLADAITKAKFDHLYIQFYNTPECSARTGVTYPNSNGQDIGYGNWATWLSNNVSPSNQPLMFIGLPGGPNAVSPAHAGDLLNAADTKIILDRFYDHPMFGGVMIWDAANAHFNPAGNYITTVHDILVACNGGPVTTTTSSTTTTTTTSTTSSTTTMTTTTTTPTTTTSSSSTTTTSTSSTTTTSSSSTTTTSSTSTSTTTTSTTTTPVATSTTTTWSSTTTTPVTSSTTTSSTTTSGTTTTSSSSTTSTSTTTSWSTTSTSFTRPPFGSTTSTSSSSSTTTSTSYTRPPFGSTTTTSSSSTTSTSSTWTFSSTTSSSTSSSTTWSTSSPVEGTSSGWGSWPSDTTTTTSTSTDPGAWTAWSSTTSKSADPTSSSSYSWSAWTTSSSKSSDPTSSSSQYSWSAWTTTSSKPVDPTTSATSWAAWTDPSSVYVTTTTTIYTDVCPTGYTTIKATITATITVTDMVNQPTGSNAAWPTGSAGLPTGFYATTAVCTAGCADGPKTVTLTIPIPKIITETLIPTPPATPVAGSSASSSASWATWSSSTPVAGVTGVAGISGGKVPDASSTQVAGNAYATGSPNPIGGYSGSNGIQAYTGGAAAEQAPATAFSVAVCLFLAVAGLVL